MTPKRSPLKALATEKKYIETAIAAYVNNTTGSITHLDIVPQGSTVNEREGKAFQPTSIQIKGVVTNGAGAAANKWANYLVWDKQPNGALATIGDILVSASSLAFPNKDKQSRFKILRAFNGTLSGQSDEPLNSFGNTTNVEEFIKLPAYCISQCTAADSLGTIAGRTTGALLWVTVGDHTAGTTAASSTVGFRMNFNDN